VDQAVLIAPGFGLLAIPAPLTVLAINGVLLQPEQFEWWDPAHPTFDASGPMAHSYPRFSHHGLVQVLRLGQAARAMARRSAPAAGSILVITNANDTSVDNAAAKQVAADWRAHGANVTTYEFPAEIGLGHDLIDPAQPDQQVDLVYAQLIELITAQP
jgi:hypothetical protein